MPGHRALPAVFTAAAVWRFEAGSSGVDGRVSAVSSHLYRRAVDASGGDWLTEAAAGG